MRYQDIDILRGLPDTLYAFLKCDGCTKFTRHSFLKRERVSFSEKTYKLIYVCSACETTRQFGNEIHIKIPSEGIGENNGE